MSEGDSETKNIFKQCKRLISKVEDGKVTRIVWQLEEWDKSLQIHKSEASCTLQLDNCSLSFSFAEHSASTPNESGGFEEASWLSLLLSRQPPSNLTEGFKVQVDRLDENLEIYFSAIPATTTVFHNDSPVVLKEDFIHLSTIIGADSESGKDAVAVCQPSCLRYGITITQLRSISNASEEEQLEPVASASAINGAMPATGIVPAQPPPDARSKSGSKIEDLICRNPDCGVPHLKLNMLRQNLG